MPRRDVHRVERQLLALTRHPAMGAFSSRPGEADRLERSAYLLLSRLDEAGPMTIKELAGDFRLNLSTINRHTAAMVRAELVERIADPNGGIARKFRITTYGRERLHRHRDWVVRGLSRIFTDWTDTEFEMLASSLEHLNASIDLRRQAPPLDKAR